MSKVQHTIVGDNSSYADFKGWAGDVTASPGTGTGIAAALYTLSFTKLADTYTAAWSAATAVPTNAGNLFGAAFPTTTNNARAQLAGTNFLGAWGVGSPPNTYVAGNVVTQSGVVYICTLAAQVALTGVLQNSSQALSTTAVANSSGGTAVYTVVGTPVLNQQYVITGMVASNNNGTFLCTAASLNSMTVTNPSATVASAQSGTSTSSTGTCSYLGTLTAWGGGSLATLQGMIGHSIATSISGSGNSATVTVSSISTTAFACTNSGTTITAAGTATENTALTTDILHWSPYFMEIWKMSASGLTDVYFKLEYGGGATATNPQLSIQFGTGYVANSGVLSGIVSTVEQCFVGTGVATSSECDWSGDGQNYFGMYMHRANATHSSFVCFERGISGQISAAPVYSTTNQYITYLAGFVGPVWHQCSLLLSSNISTTSSVRNAYGSAVNLHVAGTQTVNNTSPALPVFPLIGGTGNPMTVLNVYSVTDSSEGTSVLSLVYGAYHNYLVTVNSFAQAFGGTASIYGLGLRWE